MSLLKMRLLNLVLVTLVGAVCVTGQTTTTTAAPNPPLIDSKIVGGVDVEIIQFPYQLVLRRFNQFICGASIVSNYWFLTAAHCVASNSQASDYSVRAGSTYLNKGGMIYKVRQYVVHPEWDPETFDYDFAVMRIAKPFRYSSSMRPVCLSSFTPPNNGRVVVAGWGTTSPGGSISEHLKAANLNIVSRPLCNATYGGEITTEMICASSDGKDSCQGDSGGALVDRRSKCQCGVVSWGKSCALPEYPGIYSEVSKAKAWILATTSN